MALLFDTLQSTTREHRLPKVVDIHFKAHPFWDMMVKRDKVITGGDPIRQSMEYAEQGPAGTFAGVSLFRVEKKEFITDLSLTWAKYYGTAMFTDDEDRANRGAAQVHNLIAAKEENAVKFLRKLLTIGLYDDGTYVYDAGNAEANGLIGLKKIISESAATYAGVSETDVTDHVPIRVNAAGAKLSTSMMQDVWSQCSDGDEHPTLFLTDKTVWNQLWSLLEPAQRSRAGDRVGTWGHNALEFNGVPVYQDSFCPADSGTGAQHKMYGLNMDYFQLLYSSGEFFKRLGYKEPHNQPHLRVGSIITVAQLLCKKRSAQGIIYGIGA